MMRFISKRLFWAIPTLLIVTFLVFVAIRVGTDPVAAYKRAQDLGDNYDNAQEQVKKYQATPYDPKITASR